jgi:polyphosphate kinase
VIFPIYDEKLKKEINDILQLQLNDTKKAVLFRADLSNEKILTIGDRSIPAQEAIYNYVKDISAK